MIPHAYQQYVLCSAATPPGPDGVDRYDAEKKEHELYVIEPSGVMYRYFGAAVGKGRQVSYATVLPVFCGGRGGVGVGDSLVGYACFMCWWFFACSGFCTVCLLWREEEGAGTGAGTGGFGAAAE